MSDETVTTPADAADIQLNTNHQKILKARGIPIALALAAGLRSVHLGDLRAVEERYGLRRRYRGLPSYPVTGIEIPYPKCSDDIERCRVRMDETSYVKPGDIPGSHHGEETIEIPRYVCQAGVSIAPYILPPVLKVAADITADIYIVEAPLKALALMANGMLAIGLGGVLAGTHDKRALENLGEIVAHEELKRLKWRGRTVYVVFDAGLGAGDEHEGNPLVALGAARVQKALGQLGAIVKIVTLPYYHPQDSSPEDGKLWWATDQGPDDYIVRNGIEAFRKLVGEAVLGDPKDRLACALEAAKTKAEKAKVVADLLREPYFVASLVVCSGVELKAVAAITTKASGIGVRDLKEAASEFEARMVHRLKGNDPSWTSEFVCTATGQVRPIAANVELALRNDTELAGLVAFDEFNQCVVFRRPPPWADRFTAAKQTEEGCVWTDLDDTRLGLHLGSSYRLHDVKPEKVKAALEVVARDHAVHPVREYLLSLRWDGTKRVESWLTIYFGVRSSEYTSKVGTWWLISAVARILNPGCKVDHTLVLEGDQGLAKSSALAALAGEWFSDGDLGDLRSKEAAMLLQGIWIQELAEGEIFGRATTRALKAFTTKTFDNIVPKFSNRRTKLQRQCVFALTTNDEDDYLVDRTGNRRYWPVRCTAIDLDLLKADRDQLWAEAVALFQAGTKWWPVTAAEKSLCKVEQSDREAQDTWDDLIRQGVREQDRVTIAFVLGSILSISPKDQKRTEQLRASASLKSIGWVQAERTGLARVWVRGPNAEPRGERPPLRVVGGTGMTVHDEHDDEDLLAGVV